MKRKMLFFRMLVIMILMVMCHPILARAQEEVNGEAVSLNQFMIAQKKVEAKASPESGAETIITYETGDTIFVTGETDDGWYIVLYQGKTGYIPADMKDDLQEISLDVAGLDAEMEAEIAEAKLVVEEVERYRAEVKRSRIWGIVIVLLVIVIFAVGIISTIQVKKRKDGKVKKNGKNMDGGYVIDLDNDQDE